MKSIALVGGMNRLEHHYKDEATRFGVVLLVFNESGVQVDSGIRNSDAVVIFTNKVSHSLKIKAVKIAKARNIPVFYYNTCGIHALRGCLECLENGRAAECFAKEKGPDRGRGCSRKQSC